LRFLLDANVLSEAGKKHPHSKVLNWLLVHEPDSGVPSVALAERYQGAHNASQEQRIRLLAELDALVHEAPQRIVPFDTEAAKVWGEYTSRRALKLKPRSYPDTQIPAIALSRRLTIVTRNTQDFPTCRCSIRSWIKAARRGRHRRAANAGEVDCFDFGKQSEDRETGRRWKPKGRLPSGNFHLNGPCATLTSKKRIVPLLLRHRRQRPVARTYQCARRQRENLIAHLLFRQRTVLGRPAH